MKFSQSADYPITGLSENCFCLKWDRKKSMGSSTSSLINLMVLPWSLKIYEPACNVSFFIKAENCMKKCFRSSATVSNMMDCYEYELAKLNVVHSANKSLWFSFQEKAKSKWLGMWDFSRDLMHPFSYAGYFLFHTHNGTLIWDQNYL